MSKTDPRTLEKNKTLPTLMAEQAKVIVALQSSTSDFIKRMQKLKQTDDILNNLDLVVTGLQEQKLLTRAWSVELMSFDKTALNSGHSPLSKDNALVCLDVIHYAYTFVYSAAREMSLIEERSQKYDGGRSRISPEELATYFEAIVDLHMYLQGTIMGLQKLNAFVRRECHTICSNLDMPIEPVEVPTATMLDHAVDVLCWVGCYTESRERTELYYKLLGWRCGLLDIRTFPFDKYFDCLD